MVIFQAYVYLNFLICTLVKDQILPEQQILIDPHLKWEDFPGHYSPSQHLLGCRGARHQTFAPTWA